MKTTNGLKDIFQYLLAAIVFAGYFILMFHVLSSTIPAENNSLAEQMLGALTMGFGVVITYFFGSNKESAAKTQMIYNSTPNPEKPPITTADKTITTTETTTAKTEPEPEPIPADPIVT